MQEILNEYKFDFVPVIKPKKSSSFPSPFTLHIKESEEDERAAVGTDDVHRYRRYEVFRQQRHSP